MTSSTDYISLNSNLSSTCELISSLSFKTSLAHKMYRKYFQLTKQFTESFASLGRSAVLAINYENHAPKRWAGHSKWQNIKSTKQAMDKIKADKFNKLNRQIELAVKEKGDDCLTNDKLKALWEEAKKANMTKAKFEHCIKSAKNSTSEKPFWTLFSGPKGVLLGFEVIFANKNTNFIQSKFSPKLKKLKFKIEPHYHNLCTEKGIIITDPLPNIENAHEKALEDAIELGMDEVFENDDKTLIFECLPDRVDSFQQQLESKGYNILSATTEIDFNKFVTLDKEELDDLESVINKLKNSFSEIIRASYNVTRP